MDCCLPACLSHQHQHKQPNEHGRPRFWLRTFFLAFMKSPMMDLEEPIEFIVKDPT